MPTAEEALAWAEHHFATVTPEEFIANVGRSDPEFAREMWGDLSAAEIMGRRDQPPRRAGDVAHYDSAARPRASGERTMISPERAQAILKEYYETASDQQIVDDLWRHSPELARRLGIAPPGTHVRTIRRGPRGFFASLGRSVLRLFS
ncbi:MAG TPA: hypothetical protein VFT45_16480 [Longimicrobium sp.]|nr:hypothetical protein [Longimicrobium sp.]